MTQLGTRKSRKGCSACKQRHVKCNEGIPCSNCIRRNESCSLAVTPSPASTSRDGDDALPSNTNEWLQDMELMQYYSTYLTKERVLFKNGSGLLWQEVIPQEALKHAFLLHGLLALSALHLAYNHPEQASRCLRMCDRHQGAALVKFREALSGALTEENSAALFALATVMSVLSLARSHAMVAYNPEPRALDMDAISEGVVMAHGVRAITSSAHEFLVKHPLSQLFYGYTMPDEARTTTYLPESVLSHFTAVEQMLRQKCEAETFKACLDAWNELVDIYHHLTYFLRLGPVESGIVWRWPATLSEEATRLIQTRHPPMLVILAHYAAASGPLHGSWFVNEWGKFALQGVSLVLADDMQHWLEWPWEQLKMNLEVLLSLE
ncbi:hypothetical protein LTR78_006125 [Recurvomyces mirabilis]|uniref:Zn(2)-C6 fungal-type domain-containing protein n=1 Tax=Recurvomyces mirabilis TaxID=574656 RepID=A0AAE0WLH4_9PEZI|nr:hypothetical protein LTR78_006125 [Recurvomyces mirabilis]KAK5151968.1 hypothetical protein LTS14_008742 [Recurvomyces mirabilis]